MDELNETPKDITALEFLTQLEQSYQTPYPNNFINNEVDHELKNLVNFLKKYEEKRVLEKSISQNPKAPPNKVKI
jgi:hypothetical protein